MKPQIITVSDEYGHAREVISVDDFLDYRDDCAFQLHESNRQTVKCKVAMREALDKLETVKQAMARDKTDVADYHLTIAIELLEKLS